jgi:hypothetical protein
LEDFLKTFDSFCSKSPIQLKYNCVKETGQLQVYSSWFKEDLNFTINPLKDKHPQVHNILNSVIPFYPEIMDFVSIPLSVEEIDANVNKGVPLIEILGMRKLIGTKKYRIQRVHHKFNEIDCLNYESNVFEKFKTKIPMIKFMEGIFNRLEDKHETSIFFNSNSYLLRQLTRKNYD